MPVTLELESVYILDASQTPDLEVTFKAVSALGETELVVRVNKASNLDAGVKSAQKQVFDFATGLARAAD